MNESILSFVANLCDMDKTKVNASSLTGGRQHGTWCLQSDKIDLVVKVLNPYSYLGREEDIRFIHCEAFCSCCADVYDFPVPALCFDEQILFKVGEESIIIYPFIQGDIASLPNAAQAKVIGELLANLHGLKIEDKYFTGDSFKQLSIESWDTLSLGLVESNKLRHLQDLAALSFKAHASLTSELILSHRDINTENVIWQEALKPKLIDWESAGLIHPLVELLGLAFNFSGIALGQFHEALFAEVINSYHASCHMPLKLTEAIYLDAYLSWFVWLDYCFKCEDMSEALQLEQINITLDAIDIMSQHKATVYHIFKSYSDSE